jgi:sn-glycerol 3-phosphate transport system permease protein
MAVNAAPIAATAPPIPFRRKHSGAMFRVAGYLLMTLIVAAIGAPIYWMLTGTVKNNQQIFTFPPIWIPTTLHWNNFIDTWHALPIGRFYINSVIITVIGATAELLNATFSAYALVFLRFPARRLVFIVMLSALMVPDQIAIIPNFLTISHFFGQNYVNTYAGLILPGASVAFGTFMMRQAFMSLPREVLDAAKVDGAGHFRVLKDIVVPMSKPIIVTFGIISMVAKWNEYLWPLIVTNTMNMRPLAVGVTFLFDPESGSTQWGQVMAGAFFVIAPLVVVYIWAQRYIIEGITAGATKG